MGRLPGAGAPQRRQGTVYTRRGHDWTSHFARIAAAVAQLKATSAILDGESVVLDKDGKSDFQALRGSRGRQPPILRFRSAGTRRHGPTPPAAARAPETAGDAAARC